VRLALRAGQRMAGHSALRTQVVRDIPKLSTKELFSEPPTLWAPSHAPLSAHLLAF